MKIIKVLLLLIFFNAVNGFGAKIINHIVVLTPIYKSYDSFRDELGVFEPREIKRPGKIYVKGDFLLISDMGHGVHIINNQNYKKPEKLAFIKIPGNYDMAVKDHMLYVDSYVDFVAIDISILKKGNLKNVYRKIKEVNRIENVFLHRAVDQGYWENKYRKEHGCYDCSFEFDKIDPKKGIMTGWQVDRTKTEVLHVKYAARSSGGSGGYTPKVNFGGSGQGQGGSMARFGIYKNYLYAVDYKNMAVFHIKDLSHPEKVNQINIGRRIETIFVHKCYLFIGSEDGMYLYDICNDAKKPKFVNRVRHIRARDPVVVNRNMAFVTIRNLNGFGGWFIPVDVTDLQNPKRLSSYGMLSPHGLGVQNDLIFICQGRYGFDIYRYKKHPTYFELNQIYDLRKNQKKLYRKLGGNKNSFYDVILLKNFIIVSTQKGIFQFQYDNQLFLLSRIK